MKIIILLIVGISLIFQMPIKESQSKSPEMEFFDSIEGTWEGMPADTSFISLLEYKRESKAHFVFVNNNLLSKERRVFSHYEGVYFLNPSTSNIEFTTINKSEIHSGFCKVSGDTLFHYATINNKSGDTRAYSSAIVKENENTLAYYAVYGKDEVVPELVFGEPLIYTKKNIK